MEKNPTVIRAETFIQQHESNTELFNSLKVNAIKHQLKLLMLGQIDEQTVEGMLNVYETTPVEEVQTLSPEPKADVYKQQLNLSQELTEDGLEASLRHQIVSMFELVARNKPVFNAASVSQNYLESVDYQSISSFMLGEEHERENQYQQLIAEQLPSYIENDITKLNLLEEVIPTIQEDINILLHDSDGEKALGDYIWPLSEKGKAVKRIRTRLKELKLFDTKTIRTISINDLNKEIQTQNAGVAEKLIIAQREKADWEARHANEVERTKRGNDLEMPLEKRLANHFVTIELRDWLDDSFSLKLSLHDIFTLTDTPMELQADYGLQREAEMNELVKQAIHALEPRLRELRREMIQQFKERLKLDDPTPMPEQIKRSFAELSESMDHQHDYPGLSKPEWAKYFEGMMKSYLMSKLGKEAQVNKVNMPYETGIIDGQNLSLQQPSSI
jgi:hypothetical protein